MEGYGGRIKSIIINSLNLFRVESFGMDSKSSVLILSFTFESLWWVSYPSYLDSFEIPSPNRPLNQNPYICMQPKILSIELFVYIEFE